MDCRCLPEKHDDTQGRSGFDEVKLLILSVRNSVRNGVRVSVSWSVRCKPATWISLGTVPKSGALAMHFIVVPWDCSRSVRTDVSRHVPQMIIALFFLVAHLNCGLGLSNVLACCLRYIETRSGERSITFHVPRGDKSQ
ncbi:hypothetical protein MPSEU_000816500 [Mayamaea pseudoterrestris]|nr:hypothetical protein MPSEU_000816500 [Mayamaea pseudoterrestris]